MTTNNRTQNEVYEVSTLFSAVCYDLEIELKDQLKRVKGDVYGIDRLLVKARTALNYTENMNEDRAIEKMIAVMTKRKADKEREIRELEMELVQNAMVAADPSKDLEIAFLKVKKMVTEGMRINSEYERVVDEGERFAFQVGEVIDDLEIYAKKAGYKLDNLTRELMAILEQQACDMVNRVEGADLED